jgi:hypothetical protein
MEISWTNPSGATSIIAFDASVSERHDRSAEVTENGVERGADVSDHVRPKGSELLIEALVTNTPIEQPRSHMDGVTSAVASLSLDGEVKGGASTLQFSGTFDRVRSVHEELLGLVDRGELVTIATSLRTYENMVLTQLSVNRNASTGNSLSLSIAAKSVRIVATETVAVPEPRAPRNRRARDRGNQPTTEATASQSTQARETFTRRLVRGVGGLFSQ